MMKKRVIGIVLCLVMTISLLTGCSGTSIPKESVSSESKVSGGIDSQRPESSETQKSETQEQTSSTPESSETQTEAPEPSESQKPTPEPSESQKPTPEPSESQTTTPEPSESQSTMPEPSESQSTMPEPSESQTTTPEPSESQTTTPEPSESQKPTPEPSESQKPTPEPSESQTPTPEPSEPEEPTPSEPEEPGDGLAYEEIKMPALPNTDGMSTSQEIINVIIKPGMSDFEKVFTIHNWLTFNIDYDHSYTNYYAAETLRDRVGVCQGYAYAFREMCTLVGIETTIVGGTGTSSDGSTESHAWNQVKIGGVWYNVDVTWDDPSNGPSKDPADHSGNRYDYFLVSNETLYRDHAAENAVEGNEIKNCTSNYSRKDILKKAVETGWHGDVAFASNKDELQAAVLKYMKGDRNSLWLWYYDTSMTNDNWQNVVTAQLAELDYPARLASYYPLKDGVIKVRVEITPVSEWNQFAVVTNVDEFRALLDKNGDAGVKNYTIRYEATTGTPELAGSKYGFGYTYVPYNGGKSWIITITIN